MAKEYGEWMTVVRKKKPVPEWLQKQSNDGKPGPKGKARAGEKPKEAAQHPTSRANANQTLNGTSGRNKGKQIISDSDANQTLNGRQTKVGNKILPKQILKRDSRKELESLRKLNSTKSANLNGEIYTFNSGKQNCESSTVTGNSFSILEDTENVDLETQSNKDGSTMGPWSALGTIGDGSAITTTRSSGRRDGTGIGDRNQERSNELNYFDHTNGSLAGTDSCSRNPSNVLASSSGGSLSSTDGQLAAVLATSDIRGGGRVN